MKPSIRDITAKKKKADYPISVRPYMEDIPKLEKLAKDKNMKLHPFLVEALHIIANS